MSTAPSAAHRVGKAGLLLSFALMAAMMLCGLVLRLTRDNVTVGLAHARQQGRSAPSPQGLKDLQAAAALQPGDEGIQSMLRSALRATGEKP